MAAAEEAVGDADLSDPNPDMRELFSHYDGLYFRGALAAAGFVVQWGSPLQSRSFGSCTFSKPGNTITLSEPVLRYRSTADRKKALLHEMIHAIIFIKHQRKGCCSEHCPACLMFKFSVSTQHGPIFRAWMDAINSCSVEDDQRPKNGYNITTRHDFNPEEPHSIKGILWKCKSCGDALVRATNQGPPSDACCIENVDDDDTCGNMLCRWHNHMEGCGGTYTKMMCTDQKEDLRGTQLLLTYTSEKTSKSQGAVQESDAAGLQENTTVTEPNAEGKFLSLVNTSNVKSPRSNLKRAGKRHRLQDIEKASVPLASPPRKLKLNQSLAKSEADELISPVDHSDTRPPGRSTSKMAGKQHKLEDVLKPSVLPAASHVKLKLKQDFVSDKNELLSLSCCNNAKSPRSSSSKKEAEQRHPECTQKAFPLRKSKQDLVAPEKNERLFPFGCNGTKPLGSSTPKMAGKQRKSENVQKPSVLPAANQGKLKPKHDMVASEKNELLPLLCRSKAKSPRNSSSEKAAKQHNPESEQQNYSFRQNYSLRKRKQDLVAPCKNESLSPDGFFNAKVKDGNYSKKARKRYEPGDTVAPEKQRSNCKRKPAKKKEYAVMSVWLNYYESEGSSGSDVPLVNKRTERRKRARFQITRARSQITTPYSHSRKQINSVPLVSSGVNALVSCHKTKTEPRSDELSKRSQPLPPCSDIVAVTTDDPVVIQATGDQSQPSALCLDIGVARPAAQVIPLQSDLSGLVPSNQSIGTGIIDISDDE